MAFPLKGSTQHPDQPRVRFGGLRTEKFRKKLFSFNARDREILNAICLTAQGFAACIRLSMPGSTNTRSTMDRPIFSIWISAPQERDTKSSSSKEWRKRGSSI